MSAAEWLHGVLSAGLAVGAAALLVLALRRPWRRAFGARAVLPLWALLPWALLLSAWPSTLRPVWQVNLPAGVLPAQLAEVAASTATAGIGASGWAVEILLTLWGAGVCLVLGFALLANHRVRRFMRPGARLPLGCRSSLPLAQWAPGSPLQGPALVGLWRPHIVLPACFADTRNPELAALVLAHEHEHAARADLPVQALAWLTLALFWFVPPLWWALACLREDQELACDAALLARGVPAAAYARALIDFAMDSRSGAGSAAPLFCAWPCRHPLVERIAMMEVSAVSSMRRCLGRIGLMVAAAGMALGCSVMAAPSETLQLSMQVQTGDNRSAPVICQKLGEPASLRLEADGKPAYTVQLQVSAAADGQYRVESSVQAGGDSAPYWRQNWQLAPGQSASLNGVRDGYPNMSMQLTLERGCPASATQAGKA